MKTILILLGLQIGFCSQVHAWGFFGHQHINFHAVFLLPPQMLSFFKKNIDYLKEHAVDPDKRRYSLEEEGARHYIDIDRYGSYPYRQLPRKWEEALIRFGEDSLQAHGIVPWWVQIMKHRLTKAFKEGRSRDILQLAAEMGHYISDAHVPLHASSNHNGQLTGQRGIHGFWESRIPELMALKEWDFFIGQAGYISDPGKFIWDRVLESALAADSVLRIEKSLQQKIAPELQYAFEERNGKLMRQYSSFYSYQYYGLLNHMVERRMRESIYAVASFWYTSWVDAGQPELGKLGILAASEEEQQALQQLNFSWKTQKIKGKDCE